MSRVSEIIACCTLLHSQVSVDGLPILFDSAASLAAHHRWGGRFLSSWGSLLLPLILDFSLLLPFCPDAASHAAAATALGEA